MLDWWARAEWASGAIIDELATVGVASWGFWADRAVDAFVGALLEGGEVVGVSSAASVGEGSACVNGFVKGESGEDSGALSDIDIGFASGNWWLLGGSDASRTTLSHGGEVVSVSTTSSIGEHSTVLSLGVEGESLEDSVALSGVNVIGANLGEIWGGRWGWLWLVADGHALFLASKVVSISLTSGVSEDVASLGLLIEEPTDELSTAVSRVLWVKATVDSEQYGVLLWNWRLHMEWLLLLFLILWLLGDLFLFLLGLLGSNWSWSTSGLDSGGSGGRGGWWSSDTLGGLYWSTWGLSSGGWGWSQWSGSWDNIILLVGLFPAQLSSVRGDTDSLSGTDLGVRAVGNTRLLHSAGSFTILDTLEVVLISFASSPEEVLAFVEVGVEVETELVLVAWSALLWKGTSGSTSVGLEANSLIVLWAAHTGVLHNTASVSGWAVSLGTVHWHSDLGLQWLSDLTLWQSDRWWSATILASLTRLVVVSVSSASRVGELFALLRVLVVEEALEGSMAWSRGAGSDAFFGVDLAGGLDAITIWSSSIAGSAVWHLDSLSVDTEALTSVGLTLDTLKVSR